MPELRLTLIQSTLHWENPAANRAMFDALIRPLANTTDLIVLPEMFSTGFSMRPENFAETMEGETIQWMKIKALETGAAVCGSMMIAENEKYFNRFIWAEPGEQIYYNDKAHLFRMGDEQLHYSRHKHRLIIPYKDWNIAPFVCYDMRFPVWIKRTPDFDYDLLIFVANWPSVRSAHWKILSQARAVENQSFVVATNRVGEDGNGVDHAGDSTVYNPRGEILFRETGRPCVHTMQLELDEARKYRAEFPVSLDDDTFEIS